MLQSVLTDKDTVDDFHSQTLIINLFQKYSNHTNVAVH